MTLNCSKINTILLSINTIQTILNDSVPRLILQHHPEKGSDS